jgi:hypothetical protein
VGVVKTLHQLGELGRTVLLVGLLERLAVDALEADEEQGRSGCLGQPEQLGVTGQADRRLRSETNRQVGRGHRLEQRPAVLLVGGQVVVGEKHDDRGSRRPAGHLHPDAQLVDHGGRVAVALTSSVEADDRAEVAVDATPPGGVGGVGGQVSPARKLFVAGHQLVDGRRQRQVLPRPLVELLQTVGGGIGEHPAEIASHSPTTTASA